MAAIKAQVLRHLMKRGYDAAQARYGAPNAEYIAKLQSDAELYEQSGPSMELTPYHVLPIVITAVLMMLVIFSIDYTLGGVVATLTMIESPTSTAIVDDKPPAYADEPDAPLEKEPFMPSEAEADVEVTVIANKPVTAKISTTLRHLKQVGGFRAKWRGLGLLILYHVMQSTLTNLLSVLLGGGLFGHAVMYILSSVLLARVHMVWTHTVISQPSTKSFWTRMLPRKQSKAILLPTFVAALAQQATYILPMIVAFAVGLHNVEQQHVAEAVQHNGCAKLVSLALRIVAVPATAIFVYLAVALPATVTLIRIEALLLSDTDETIVPFDRQAIMADIDITARGSSKKLFVSAWRSFDRASRWRLIKLICKIVMIQLTVFVVGLQLIAAELYVVGGEKLALLFKSGSAQLQLMAIEASEAAAAENAK